MNLRLGNRINNDSPCGVLISRRPNMTRKALLHGAKDAKFGENSKIVFFAGLAQPKADPSQPEADPSSGGLWRSLARKTLLRSFC